VVAVVTAPGRRLLERVARRRAHGMRRILSSFTDEERRSFADDLDRFVAAIDDLVRELDAG
jgi:DNA-binding MarR family transcriptional regulator